MTMIWNIVDQKKSYECHKKMNDDFMLELCDIIRSLYDKCKSLSLSQYTSFWEVKSIVYIIKSCENVFSIF